VVFGAQRYPSTYSKHKLFIFHSILTRLQIGNLWYAERPPISQKNQKFRQRFWFKSAKHTLPGQSFGRAAVNPLQTQE